ncbi:MAG TPA: efflux RND transporter periplasmic adaptor subunit [Candidatus Polarisedimenticolaceae bacterium]|nr:efflux RND transporter periplasmic adaptor subunit [Candidatus Polarisedimenticolaceae bacterium]
MRIPPQRERRTRPARAAVAAVSLGVVVGAGLIVGATGCGGANEAQSRPGASAASHSEAAEEKVADDAIAVAVAKVARAPLSSLYSTSATLRADKRATVTARTRGVVEQLLVEEGDWVAAEQPVAVLENDEQRIAFEQAAAISATKDREYARAESLHAQGLLSEEEYETTRREAVELRHAAELAELNLSRTVIRATFAGQVLTRHLDPGATVADGTPVYDIADLDPLYADIQVPERQIEQLLPGQTVRLLNETDQPVAEASIERIAPAVDPTTGTVKVTVSVSYDRELRPGSFVRVGIVTDTHEHALVVPRSALVSEGRRWHLFRIKDGNDSAVELIEITRGFEESDRVEVLGVAGEVRPLREGDRVVVRGASSLSADSVVQIIEETGDDSGASGVAA